MNSNSGHLNNDELEANVQRFKFLDATQKIFRKATSPAVSVESMPDASSREDSPGGTCQSAPTWDDIVSQMRGDDVLWGERNVFHRHNLVDIRQAVRVLNKKLEMTNQQLCESQRNKQFLTLKIKELEERLRASGVALPGETFLSEEDRVAKTMERLKDLAEEAERREKLVESLEEQERYLRANLKGAKDWGSSTKDLLNAQMPPK